MAEFTIVKNNDDPKNDASRVRVLASMLVHGCRLTTWLQRIAEGAVAPGAIR